MRPILFELGPIRLHSYGLLLVIGFFAAIWNACREAERRGFKPELVLDMALPLLLFSVIACRLLYVLLNLDDFPTLFSVVRVWDGGLSFHGSFIGGFGVLGYFAYKRKIAFLTLCDLIAPSVFLGYFFGRIGCFLNGCCYGTVCELPWAMQFPLEHQRGAFTPPSHPAQLYSAILALILFFAMQKIKLMPRFNRFTGQLTLLFLAFYAVERGFIEYFRLGATARTFFGISWLSKAQFVSIVALVVVAVLWQVLSRRGSKPETQTGNLQVNVPTR
jgi:phosphatidylglycerol---prolipoprotein diacylglyceryl transferase